MKKVTFSKRLLINGAVKTANILKNVFGPLAGNSLIEKQGQILSTRDGAQVCRSLEFEDPIENLSLKIIREGALKVEDTVGDGTTSTVILTVEILKELIKYTSADEDLKELFKELNKTKKSILENIIPYLKKEPSFDNIKYSILTSLNGDIKTAELISDALMKVGKGGVVSVQDGEKVEDVFEIQTGFQINFGYENTSYLKDSETEIFLDGCAVLLLNDFLFNESDIIPVLEAASEFQRPLCIFSLGVLGEAQRLMIFNTKKDVIRSCSVRSEGNKFTSLEFLKDIQCFTGGTIIDPLVGITLKEFKREYLGFTRSIRITNKKTLIQAYPENLSIQERLKSLTHQRTQTNHEWDYDRLSNRIANLSGGYGVLKIGGLTLPEKQERKGRIEDALLNGKACVEYGLLPGGGSILPIIYNYLDEGTLGEKILKDSLKNLFNTLYRDEGYLFYKLGDFQKNNLDKNPEEWAIDYKDNEVKILNLYEPYNLFSTILEVSIANACQIVNTSAIISK